MFYEQPPAAARDSRGLPHSMYSDSLVACSSNTCARKFSVSVWSSKAFARTVGLRERLALVFADERRTNISIKGHGKVNLSHG